MKRNIQGNNVNLWLCYTLLFIHVLFRSSGSVYCLYLVDHVGKHISQVTHDRKFESLQKTLCMRWVCK